MSTKRIRPPSDDEAPCILDLEGPITKQKRKKLKKFNDENVSEEVLRKHLTSLIAVELSKLVKAQEKLKPPAEFFYGEKGEIIDYTDIALWEKKLTIYQKLLENLEDTLKQQSTVLDYWESAEEETTTLDQFIRFHILHATNPEGLRKKADREYVQYTDELAAGAKESDLKKKYEICYMMKRSWEYTFYLLRFFGIICTALAAKASIDAEDEGILGMNETKMMRNVSRNPDAILFFISSAIRGERIYNVIETSGKSCHFCKRLSTKGVKMNLLAVQFEKADVPESINTHKHLFCRECNTFGTAVVTLTQLDVIVKFSLVPKAIKDLKEKEMPETVKNIIGELMRPLKNIIHSSINNITRYCCFKFGRVPDNYIAGMFFDTKQNWLQDYPLYNNPDNIIPKFLEFKERPVTQLL